MDQLALAATQVWRDARIGDVTVRVSSLGRVETLTGEKLEPFKAGRRTLHVAVTSPSGARHVVAHDALVCWAFHGEPPAADSRVRHINGSFGASSNRADNLAWTRKQAISVSQYELDGSYVASFPTVTAAVQAVPTASREGIASCCDNRSQVCGGFRWRRAAPGESESARRSKAWRVLQSVPDGTPVAVYRSVEDAAAVFDVPSEGIHACCTGKRKSCAHFLWRYEDVDADAEATATAIGTGTAAKEARVAVT
jgi:hypothetical protein